MSAVTEAPEGIPEAPECYRPRSAPLTADQKIGRLIDGMCTKRSMSKETLAKKAGLKPYRLKQILEGKKPSAADDELTRIALALECHPDLFSYEAIRVFN